MCFGALLHGNHALIDVKNYYNDFFVFFFCGGTI